MNKPSRTPGICRIDQPSHRTHGFFVRMQRNGKMHSAFFSDLTCGGRKAAMSAAQQHYQKMQLELGPPKQASRRAWAEIRRRKSSSHVVGVQRLVIRRKTRLAVYWMATWSPEVGVVRRMMFSVRKYGAQEAKQLAILARRRGVSEME